MSNIKIRIEKNLSVMDTGFRRTIDSMFRMINTQFTFNRHAWRPHTNIFEMDREFVVTAELAGVDISDIHVETDQRTLKISGIRRERPYREEGSFLLAEIPSGYFEMIFTLPSLIVTEAVTASYSDGILQIRLKKMTHEIIQSIIVRSI